MATWTLTLNNSNNTADKVYIMEDDESGIITTPDDLFYPACFNVKTYNSNLIKRYYQSIAIGGTNFPPVCKEIAARGSGSLIVAKDTKSLKVWTYKDGTWTIKDNITKGIGGDGTPIVIPSFVEKKR